LFEHGHLVLTIGTLLHSVFYVNKKYYLFYLFCHSSFKILIKQGFYGSLAKRINLIAVNLCLSGLA